MAQIVVKLIEIITIALAIAFSVAGVAGFVSVLATKKKYPARDKEEVRAYKTSFHRFVFFFFLGVIFFAVNRLLSLV